MVDNDAIKCESSSIRRVHAPGPLRSSTRWMGGFKALRSRRGSSCAVAEAPIGASASMSSRVEGGRAGSWQ